MPNIRGPLRRKRKRSNQNVQSKESRLSIKRENLFKLVVALRKKYVELDKTYEALVEGEARLLAKQLIYARKEKKKKKLENRPLQHGSGQSSADMGPTEEEKNVNKIKLNLKSPFIIDVEEEEDSDE